MNYELLILNPESVSLEYSVPEHLQGIQDIPGLRKADLKLLYVELKEKGSSLGEKISSGIIWRMNFPEMILDVSRLDYDGKSAKLFVSPIHPHRADLAYKKDGTLPRNVVPFTVTALVKDVEDNFILGIRGGKVESGKLGIIPGGYVDYTYPPIINPLVALRNEFKEELGYEFKIEGDVPIVGLFTNRDIQGMNVLYIVKTDLKFLEILEKWKGAKDKEEHTLLFRATQEDIKQLAETGQLSVGNKVYSTTPFFQDCFKIASLC